jgi:hypothetical protein
MTSSSVREFPPLSPERHPELNPQLTAVVPWPRTAANTLHPVGGDDVPGDDLRLCGRPDCAEPARERRGRTGRPSEYCSDRCRTLASRSRAALRRAALRATRQRVSAAGGQGQTRFGTTLTDGLRTTGLTLEEMSLLLRTDHDVYVSPSAISNWTHGRLPRRTPDDERRTAAIEQVLKQPAGEMRFLLERDRANRRRGLLPAGPGPRRPNGEEDPVRDLRDRMVKVGGSDAYAVIAVEERVLIGEDHKEYKRTVRLRLRALDEHTDCYRLVYTPDDGESTSAILARRNCRRGRELVGPGGLAGIELLFDRVLEKGEAYEFDYQEVVEHSGEPQCWVRRGVGHSSVDLLKTVVRFAVPPARVWACRWDKRGEHPIDLVPVALDGDTVTLLLQHPSPGLHGLTWSW